MEPLSLESMREAVIRLLDQSESVISDTDDLISHGLDSIRIMSLVGRWRRNGARVTFAELAESPTLESWWQLVSSRLSRPAAGEPGGTAVTVDSSAPFALTPVQHAYWVGRGDDQPLGGVGCHAYFEFEGRDVDPARLEAAVHALTGRHGMLRARFLDDGRQQIMPASAWSKLGVHDARGLDAEQAAARRFAVRDAMSHRRLPVERGEVFDVQLSVQDGGVCTIHLSVDLLVADVLSIQILLADLAQIYAGRGDSLPTLSYDFPRYLARRNAERTEARERAKAYWRERVDAMPGAPQLPLAASPEAIQRPRFSRRIHRLARDEWQRFAERARQLGITPAMAVLSAYVEVLGAWSAAPRFLVNLPLFDREAQHRDAPHLVADFTNLVLVTADVSQPRCFLDRALEIQAQFRADAAHAEYSGLDVLRDLARANPAEPRTAPVVFACNIGSEFIGDAFRRELGELRWMLSQTPQVWLDHQVYEINGELVLCWDAVDALFPDGLVDAMFGAYGSLVDRLAAPDADWAAPPRPLLPDAQRQVRAHVNATHAPESGQLIHAGFYASAARAPDRPALLWDEGTLSYGELADRSLRLAALLRDRGVRAGDLVAIQLPKGPDQIVAVLGVLAAGGVYVPLGVDQPASRQRRIVERTGLRWAVQRDGTAAAWPSEVHTMSIEDALARAPLPAPVAIEPGAPAYVIFTSGSTGEPKGVEIAHRAAVNTIDNINARHGVAPTDRVLAVSALDFDLSVYDIFGLLSAGGALVLIREDQRRDAAAWADLVARHGVTLWNSVPTLLDMLLVAADGRPLLSTLRLALASGEWVGLDLHARLATATEARCALVALGGATEASIWSNAFPVTGVPAHWTSIPYGFPLRNQAYRVVDAQGRDCPDWVPGELWIGGAGVATGYRSDPDQTRSRFVDATDRSCAPEHGTRWYRTGDLGRYWPDGTLEFLGRLDHQVKIRGHRIEIGEIEAAIAAHPAIGAGVVAPIPHDNRKGYRALAAFVIPKPTPLAREVDEAHPGATILDPLERAEFKLRELGLRREPSRPRIALGPSPEGDALLAHVKRRTDREFLTTPIPLSQFGDLLACLRRVEWDGLPKYRYPSGGGLYPVQTYVHVKPDRIEGIAGGIYYYDPRESSLISISDETIDRSVHGAHNHAVVDASAFSIFLIVDRAAIEPMYGELARDLYMLEAGYMGQLLMDWAASNEIGLCPIGGLAFERIRPHFDLGDQHRFVHALVGGRVDRSARASEARPTLPLGDDVQAWLRDRLPEYMVPAHVVVLEELPRTSNGKVDRKSLPALLAHASDGAMQRVAPRTPIEQRLAALWCELLELPEVGVTDDFLELGGHSLSATRMIARLRGELQVEIGLRNVFQLRTIAELARFVDRCKATRSEFVGVTDLLPALTVEPARRHEPFPLTDTQQAYCLGRVDAFELGNVSTHVYMELEGDDLDLARFERAWQRLLDRHDMLRAVMSPDTSEQRILAEVPPFKLQVNDLRTLDAGAASARLAQIREQMSHEVRPADQFPLFDVFVSRLDDRRSRIHWSVDALISDFASWQVLFRELSELYADPERELPVLEVSFRDYVLAERRIEGTELHRRSQKYWLERLSTLPPAPELPMTKEPSSVAYPRFVRRQGVLSAHHWERVKTRATQAGLTPSGLVLAAYAEIVGAWSRNLHFTLNVPRLNRLPLHPQVNDLVGEFASFTLLEVDNRARESFEVRARRVQEQLWTDLEHQYVSGVWVLRELMRAQGSFSRALMPVVLTSTLALPREHGTQLERSLRLAFGVSQTPQVWLDHQVEERDGELRFNWDAVEELFPAGMIDDMFGAYTALLQRLASDESAWTDAALALVPLAHRERRDETRIDRAIPDVLVHDAFRRQVARQPDRPAVVAADRTLSYRELDETANQVAHWLRARGARPNTLVAIVMEKGWEQIVAAIATLVSGAAYVPIDAHLPPQRIQHILERGGAQLVLTQSRLEHKLPGGGSLQQLCLDLPLPLALPKEPLSPVQRPDDLAYTLFTSGSTGQPKGVMIAHRGLVNCLEETQREFGIGETDRCLAVTALHHDMSLFDIFGMLGAGGTVVVPDRDALRDASAWAALIARHGVTIWNSVPASMEMLLEDTRDHDALGSLRLAFLGGDWIPLAIPARLRARAPRVEVVSVGGPTETTLWNIWYRIGAVEPSWRSIPYGKPIANTRYYVLDERLEDRPDWVTGEMYCAGPGVAAGYWEDPERTAAAFVRHPRTGERIYRTGDLGRFLPDGNLEFMGRADFQVKVRGHRIELGEIEVALAAHHDVKAAVVSAIPYPDRPGFRGLTAFVVPASGATPSASELARHLRERLPDHMVPATFTWLTGLPLTVNNKIDRKALAAIGASRSVEDEGFVAPRSALEAALADVWKDVLGLERVGIHDDFFRVGGDSLLATKIVARLKDIFEGTAISLKVLFTASTIAAMAESLTGLERTPGHLEAIAQLRAEIEQLSAVEVDAALSRARSSTVAVED